MPSEAVGLRAWAVVCKGGKFHEAEAFGDAWIYPWKSSAEGAARHADILIQHHGYYDCGPHTVVELGPIWEVTKLQEELEAALTILKDFEVVYKEGVQLLDTGPRPAWLEMEGDVSGLPKTLSAYHLLRERGRL